MVTRTVTLAQQQRQDADGNWLCNIDAKCNDVATVQAHVGCDDCELLLEEAQQRIDAKRAAYDEALAGLTQIQDVLDTDGRAPDAREVGAITTLQGELATLGAALEQLEATAQQRRPPHTHPAFACDKHGRKAGLIPTH